jgi:hypothetical protein
LAVKTSDIIKKRHLVPMEDPTIEVYTVKGELKKSKFMKQIVAFKLPITVS